MFKHRLEARRKELIGLLTREPLTFFETERNVLNKFHARIKILCCENFENP